MDHINLFQTNAEFLSAYTSEEYVEPWVSYTMATSGVAYNKRQTPPSPYLSIPLTIEVTAGTGTLAFNRTRIKYKVNDGEWTLGNAPSIEVSNGDKIELKQDLEQQDASGDYLPLFAENDVNGLGYIVYGNLMSVYQESGFESLREFSGEEAYTFANLFYQCAHLSSAENLMLPVETLTEYCYQSMFNGCTSLTSAPELPATTLAESCYECMFFGCTSLTSAPELPATALTYYCYDEMFGDCTSLTSAPALPATTLANACYERMFQRCTSLTSAPALPATTLAYACYNDMFNGCTSITSAPALPATALTSNCYANMFADCTSLTTAPSILPATTLAQSCYYCMFINCTSLTTAPELPATTLAASCYWAMFRACTNLNYIKCLATNISEYGCTSYWVESVASTGTFVKNPNMSSWTIGENGIPDNWTVQDAN